MDGKCPFCASKVTLKKTARIGDLIYCPECDAELEVLRLKPVELDAPLEDYDENDYLFSDDDDDDFDDDDDYDYDDDDDN